MTENKYNRLAGSVSSSRHEVGDSNKNRETEIGDQRIW